MILKLRIFLYNALRLYKHFIRWIKNDKPVSDFHSMSSILYSNLRQAPHLWHNWWYTNIDFISQNIELFEGTIIITHTHGTLLVYFKYILLVVFVCYKTCLNFWTFSYTYRYNKHPSFLNLKQIVSS